MPSIQLNNLINEQILQREGGGGGVGEELVKTSANFK